MSESITAEDKKQNRQKPPRSVGRIVGEILAGMGMGFVVGLLVGCVEGIVLFHGIGDGATRIAFMATLSKVAPPLYGIASAVGVYLVGSRGKQTGSILLTLAFGFLAGLLNLAMLPLANRLPEVLIVILFCSFSPLVLLAPPIMAALGFNLTRRYKEPVLPRSSSG